MEIVPDQEFRDALSIPAEFNAFDPRYESFEESDLTVNLQGCRRIHPSGVLWCAIYLLLAKRRGSNCTILAPEDALVSTYLDSTGLFRLLSDKGVEVECNIKKESKSDDIIVPLTRFDDLLESEEFTNRVSGLLTNSRRGSANIYRVIYEAFAELANNAVEHSGSGIGAYGLVEASTDEQDRQISFVIADGGVGIRESLEPYIERNRYHGYEWEAIALSVRELVSGTSSNTRGIGLFSVLEEATIPGRELVIHSGKGILTVSKDSQIEIVRASIFPGTLVHFSTPT